jgi:hypothetical protein
MILPGTISIQQTFYVGYITTFQQKRQRFRCLILPQVLADFKPDKPLYLSGPPGGLGHIIEGLSHGLGIVLDKGLIDQAVVLEEFGHFAIDNLVHHIGGFVFDLFGSDFPLAGHDRRIHGTAIQGDRVNRGDVHGDIAGDGLERLANGITEASISSIVATLLLK